jgi:glycosyltransferase involved in cell wall biosynthesis
MNVVLIATRDPGGRRSGGRAVLRSVIESLSGLGCKVDVLVVTRQQLSPDIWPDGVSVWRVRAPSLAVVFANVIVRATTGRLSLNECLFYGPGVSAEVKRAAGEAEASVVIADTLRAWELARRSGRPTVLALEDLLSERYRRAVEEKASAGRNSAPVLGYYRDTLPAPLRRPAEWLARQALGLESRLIRRRELVAGEAAAVVTLVSPVEATLLSTRLRRPVVASSISVTTSALRREVAPADDRIVFVGGLDYRPNVDALRWYRDAVIPVLDGMITRTVVLHAFGFVTDEVRYDLESDRIVLHGFVDDIAAALATFQVFAAPILASGGIKIKVVEAFAAGLTVVATPAAIEALAVRPGEECYVGDGAEGFASALVQALDDPLGARSIAEAGRALVERDFSPAAVAARWTDMLASAAR